MKTAVIYVRTRSCKNSQAHIEMQISICTEFANANGFTVVDTYIDKEILGQNNNRLALSKMMQDSQTATWNAVIVTNADRICRKLLDLLSYEETLKKYGKYLLSVNGGNINNDFWNIRNFLKEYHEELLKRRKN